MVFVKGWKHPVGNILATFSTSVSLFNGSPSMLSALGCKDHILQISPFPSHHFLPEPPACGLAPSSSPAARLSLGLWAFFPHSLGPWAFFPHSTLLLEAPPSDGFNYHLNADDSQISRPSLDLSPFLQSHISFCLQNISTWVSHHLLKLNMSDTELIISPQSPSFSPCFSKAVNSTLSSGSNPRVPRWAQGSPSPHAAERQLSAPTVQLSLRLCSPTSLRTLEWDFERTTL